MSAPGEGRNWHPYSLTDPYPGHANSMDNFDTHLVYEINYNPPVGASPTLKFGITDLVKRDVDRPEQQMARLRAKYGASVQWKVKLFAPNSSAARAAEQALVDMLKADASERTESGFLYVTTHAEIENGYFSGYEMLHGTDKNVGDFQIWGDANYSKEQVTYNLTLRWNDKIDPNFSYRGDMISFAVLHALYSPKDYDIHITWKEKYTIKLITK